MWWSGFATGLPVGVLIMFAITVFWIITQEKNKEK